ncbi:MAG: AsmA family protein [Pseudomonadota bacterium]
MSPIKIVILVIVLIPVLLFGAIVFLVSNPDYYRDQLNATFTAETGFELDIRGDMSWRYFPPIALRITDVAVTPVGSDMPLATMNEAAVDMDLLPLLFGGDELAINGISVDGLTINARVDKMGRGNWETTADTSQGETETASADGNALGLNIQSVSITNTTITYVDETGPSDYTITMPILGTGAVVYNQPTSTQFEVNLVDNLGGMTADLAGSGDLIFDRGFEAISFKGLRLKQEVDIPDFQKLVMNLTLDGSYNTTQSKLETTLTGSLDNIKLEGSLGADLADRTAVTFDLSMDTLRLDDYMTTTDTEATSTDATTPAEDVEVLPLETLRTITVNGKARIGTITYDTFTFTDLLFNLQNQRDQLKVDMNMAGYDGTFNIAFNGTSAAAGAGHTHARITGVDITRLTEFEWITGTIELESNSTFTGNMLGDVLGTLDGLTTFNIARGTLDVTPIKGIASIVDSLRSEKSGIGDWPDKMPFENLKGQHRLVGGVAANQQLNFSLENLKVDGTGGIDYFNNSLAYDLRIQLTESDGAFSVAPGLARITWPLKCAGAMDASPVDLCLPNRDAIADLITDVAKQEIKRKATDAVKEKAGNLLKGLFN